MTSPRPNTNYKAVLFLPLVLASCFLFHATRASAADLHLTGLDNDTVLPETISKDWAGQYSLYDSPQLKASNDSLTTTLKTFVLGNYTGVPKKTSTSINPTAVYQWLQTLAAQSTTKVQEPELHIENGKATTFTPPKTGLGLDVVESTRIVLTALDQTKTEAALQVHRTEPKTKLGDLNTLGIQELVARGESNFAGSPSNRRHNIKVGTEKFSGVIIQRGEEFSFNKYLGSVDAKSGFLPELVIKKEGTVPEFGGGLCQVSSTTFRAAMKAGLPITARRNHSYAVKYYAPQGTDATIYPGSADLKFINDTPGAILIWPYQKDQNTLVFDFYGTKDDRTVTLETPVQYDKKSDGSMKASWTRVMVKNGVESQDVFKSVYLPPALFHKQEEFVPTNGTTTTPPTTPTIAPQGVQ